MGLCTMSALSELTVKLNQPPPPTMITRTCVWLVLCLSLAVSSGTGCASGGHERAAGHHADDAALARRVAGALREDPEYKFDDVNVASYKATTQLSGFVHTAEQKEKAGQIAEKVPGVKDVINNITLKEKAD